MKKISKNLHSLNYIIGFEKPHTPEYEIIKDENFII